MEHENSPNSKIVMKLTLPALQALIGEDPNWEVALTQSAEKFVREEIKNKSLFILNNHHIDHLKYSVSAELGTAIDSLFEATGSNYYKYKLKETAKEKVQKIVNEILREYVNSILDEEKIKISLEDSVKQNCSSIIHNRIHSLANNLLEENKILKLKLHELEFKLEEIYKKIN